MTYLRPLLVLCACWLMPVSSLLAQAPFQAGVFAKNITPTKLPVWVNGNIAGVQADRVHDPLHARCLVMSQNNTTLAICIVDNCILPLDLVERARELTVEKCGIPASNILIAATHTHSAVSVAGVHGTPIQEDYAAELPAWIADGIHQALQRRVDAQLGWGYATAEKFIHCRRWLMRAGSLTATPFTGRDSDEVVMNPGHENENKIAPVGPIDRTIPILSIQTRTGKPLAVLASFSTHYAGSPALSADYFGVVANRLASSLAPEGEGQFLGIMANATSGDANCIDFSKPREPFTHIDVGNYVADLILAQLPLIQHNTDITLDAAFSSLTMDARVPSEAEVQEAQAYIDSHFPDRLPQNLIENYARETVLLSQLPTTRVVNCQALRIGNGTIVANPCESYGETGLKLRRASPFLHTMNIGLANGHAGYIPPPAHFQLGGYTTWRARTSCLPEQAEPAMVNELTKLLNALQQRAKSRPKLTAFQPPAEEPALDEAVIVPARTSPLSPDESLKLLKTEPNWIAELVASEPLVIDPVAMQIDARGNLWVIQMGDYPNGPVADEKPRGRLVVLSDENDDFVYETSRVFADNLLFATGLQLWKDGALVTLAGELIWLRDTDGDGKADQRERWLQGFQEQNPQLRANDPTLAWDSRIYVANGLRGGMVTDAKAIDRIPLANHDLRVHPFTGTLQLLTGPAQFGITWDRHGNRYFCSNRQPCREVVIEPHHSDLTTLPGLVASTRDASPSESLSAVRPIVDAWTTSNLHAGQFTAACGVMISESPQFAGTAWSQVLTCEPTGSLVQRRSLMRQAGKTSVTPFEFDYEWLASTDPWFRPVNLYEGPAGEIYVLDMHRAVIEHPEWVPEELKRRPDERFGDQAGRIFRLSISAASVRETFAQLKATPLATATDELLVKTLDSPNTWMRQTAQRLLLESDPKRHANQNRALLSLLESAERDEAKLLCLGILSVRGKLLEDAIELGLADDSPVVRTAVWRLMADYNAPSTASLYLDHVIHSLSSTDVDEVRSVCWALARAPRSGDIGVEWIEQQYLPAIDKQFRGAIKDPATLMAIGAATQSTLLQWMKQVHRANLSQVPPLSTDPEVLHYYSTAITAWMRRSMETDRVATEAFVMQCLHDVPLQNQSLDMRLALLATMNGFLQGGGALSGVAATEWMQFSTDLARDAALASEIRSMGLQVLSLLSWKASRDVARTMLREESVPLLQSALVKLQADNDPLTTEAIFEQFSQSPPYRRNLYFQAIRGNPARMASFIERLEKGDYPVAIIDTAQRQSLNSTLDKALLERLQKLFGDTLQSDRQAVVEKYREAFSLTPNRENGKRMFAQHCAACHKVDNVGTAIGPDISDSRDQNFDKLLVAILDPNRSIDANFFRYICQTKDGEIIDGLIEESSQQHVVFRTQNGSRVSVPRAEIQDLKATGVSLMPVGFEAQLSPQAMIDLLSYIKNWRYAP